MPARHANVIKQHKHVVKETTFLHDDDKGIDKDKVKDRLEILGMTTVGNKQRAKDEKEKGLSGNTRA